MINKLDDVVFIRDEITDPLAGQEDPGIPRARQITVSLPAETGWMGAADHRAAGVVTVSANELTSLSALIAYVSFKTGASEFRTERELSDRFNVPNVKCLPAALFDQAIRFLVDRVPAEISAA